PLLAVKFSYNTVRVGQAVALLPGNE
ncbi:hypothetical protein BMETH_3982223230222, partial [methanotrophic bacterial endosymbiont of Bathymodiolus sp.]